MELRKMLRKTLRTTQLSTLAALLLPAMIASAQEVSEPPEGAEVLRVIEVSADVDLALEVVADDETEGGIIGIYLGEGNDGAIITGLVPGGPAANAGLRPGDRVSAVGDHRVSSGSALRELLGERHAGEVVGVTVVRDGWRKGFELGLVAQGSLDLNDAAAEGLEDHGRMRLLHTLHEGRELPEGVTWTMVGGPGDAKAEHGEDEECEVHIIVEADGGPEGLHDSELSFGLRAMIDGSDVDVENLIKKGLEFEWIPAGHGVEGADIFERVRRIYESHRGERGEDEDCDALDSNPERHGQGGGECRVGRGGAERHGQGGGECRVGRGGAECHGEGGGKCPVGRGGAKRHGEGGGECHVGRGGAKRHGEGGGECHGQGGGECHGQGGGECHVGRGGADCHGEGGGECRVGRGGAERHGQGGGECHSDGGRGEHRDLLEGACPLAEGLGGRLDPRAIERVHEMIRERLGGFEHHGDSEREHHGGDRDSRHRDFQHHGDGGGPHHGDGGHGPEHPDFEHDLFVQDDFELHGEGGPGAGCGGERRHRIPEVRTGTGRRAQESLEELHAQIERLSSKVEALGQAVRRLSGRRDR
ncbi:MAG: hypothetical protein CMJ84_18220 [Planctomycetes bacterium]|nr:hypothetical protein [Planctomycetota bacterium]MDP6410533.1 PDZ domain-containing protein [Planctomycetota bacterium]